MFQARSYNDVTLYRIIETGMRAVGFCVFAASFLLMLRPAQAQLRFRVNSTHSALWRRLYSSLPTTWKAQELVYVRELSDEEMDRFIEEFEGPNSKADSIVDGCYRGSHGQQESAGQITLRESLRGESAALVFMHEYGHYIWANLLTDTDRTRYRRIWREQKRGRGLVTAYAGESDEEGFAEAFAFFIRRPAVLRKSDLKSWKFLSEIRDSGTEPSMER
jgi:hypothetical protein